jgi:hypothetical protein
LASKIILPTGKDVTFAFNTLTISINANVTVGDHLGFSISGPDFSPYCHLEYDTRLHPGGIGQGAGKLFAQGAGQNSWRGLDAKTSVVYEREGRGIKFFAKVV